MITTRKIKLTVLGDDKERKRAYSCIKNEQYNQFKALNQCMSHMYFNSTAKNKIQQVLEIEDEKVERKDALDVFKKAISKSERTNLRNILEGSDLMSDTKDRVVAKITQDFTNDIREVLCGNKSIRNYKRTNPLLVRVRNWKFNEIENDYILTGFFKKIQFKVVLGTYKNKNELENVIRKIIKKEYKMCDSSLSFNSKKHLILNLTLDIPENKIYTPIKGKIVGVDLGLAIPAYCAVNDNSFERKAIGSYDDFIRVRLGLQNHRKQLQKNLKSIPHSSRKKKLSALERLKSKESRFIKTYNHYVSKSIIDFAKKVKAEQINLELLEGFSKEHKDSFVLRNWSYYELQQFIEYKAEREGIKVTYVDPYHTSQTCSDCGHYEKGQRKEQSKFVCANCGLKINADLNASRNIAKSNKYVTDRSQCEYNKRVDVQ